MNAMMQTMRTLGTPRIIALTVVGVLLLAGFALLSLRLASPTLSPLYSNLSLEDGGQIAAELDQMGVHYEVAAGGTQILVPADDVPRIRMALAQKGMPSKGSIVGYEIFDKSEALGTSNFVQNVNLLRALEGELARTITAFNDVSSARVHLVIPKRQLFNRDQVEPSASVVLTLRNRTEVPSKEKIQAISHMVATAVPGLSLSRITVVDSNGKLLAKGGSDPNNPDVMAADAEERRVGFEARMKRTIEQLLEQSVGEGRVRAEVSAIMGFDRVVTNSEVYDPEGKVERSIQSSQEKESSADGNSNTVSVGNNLPDRGQDQGAGGAKSNSERVDETTNYEISKTVTNKVSEIGNIKRLSVAVLVDGVYTKGEDGKSTYAPRSDEELEKLKTLVKSTMGFDEKRGDTLELVNMPFSKDLMAGEEAVSAWEWLKSDLHSIVKTLVIGIVAVLVILLVIRPLVNRAFEMTPLEAENNAANALAGGGGGGGGSGVAGAGGGGAGGIAAGINLPPVEDSFDLDQIQQRMRGSPMKKVNELIESNPDATLSVLRNWLVQK